MVKLQWWGYQMVKNFYARFSRFGTVPACDRQTDRQMDGQTPAHGNSQTYCVARAKTDVFLSCSVLHLIKVKMLCFCMVIGMGMGHLRQFNTYFTTFQHHHLRIW